jgi:hypothetical protein
LLGSRIVFLAVRSEVSVAKAWAVKYDGGGPHLHESFKCPVTLTFSPIANRIPISIFIPQTAGYGTRGSTYISVRAVVAGKRNSLPRTRSAFSTRSWPQAPTAHSKASKMSVSGYDIAAAALYGIALPPLLVDSFLSIFLVRRRSDPVRLPFVWFRLALLLFILYVENNRDVPFCGKHSKGIEQKADEKFSVRSDLRRSMRRMKGSISLWKPSIILTDWWV